MVKRNEQIEQLRAHLQLKKLNKTHLKELIIFTMANFNVSRRTAREYIDVALYMEE